MEPGLAVLQMVVRWGRWTVQRRGLVTIPDLFVWVGLVIRELD